MQSKHLKIFKFFRVKNKLKHFNSYLQNTLNNKNLEKDFLLTDIMLI